MKAKTMSHRANRSKMRSSGCSIAKNSMRSGSRKRVHNQQNYVSLSGHSVPALWPGLMVARREKAGLGRFPEEIDFPGITLIPSRYRWTYAAYRQLTIGQSYDNRTALLFPWRDRYGTVIADVTPQYYPLKRLPHLGS